MNIKALSLYFLVFFSLSVLGQSNLPIYTTTLSKTSLPTGFSHSGLGSDYAGPKLKFDHSNDELVVSFNSVPANITFDVGLSNNFSGTSSNATIFKVQEATATGTFTDLATYGNGTTFTKGSKTITTVASTTRRLKFILSTKIAGTNVSLYNINIASGGPPCTSPNSVSSITFPSKTNSTVSGTITAGAGSTDGYVVFGSTTATPPTIADGTKYNSSNTPSGFFFVSDMITTSFTSIGLTASTSYYFHAFSYNNVNCSSGPDYASSYTASETTDAPYSNSNSYNFDGTTTLDGKTTNISSLSGSASYPSGATYGNPNNGGQVNNATGVFTSCIYTTVSMSELSFDLASLSGTSGNGAEDSDMVDVDISIDGGSTYSTILTVVGNSNARWSYTATGIANAIYSAPTTIGPSGGGVRTTDGYSKIKVANIPAGDIGIRITAKNNSSGEYWAIDNIKLASNSTFLSQAISVSSESISPSGSSHILTWDNPTCFTKIVVIARASNAPTFNPATHICSSTTGDCVSGDFTASASFGVGSSNTNLPTDEYCVYNGTGTTVTVTGLSNGTTYHYEIFTHLNPWSTKGSSPNLSISALPVELLSFEAISHQDYTVLTWQTASEINNSHFDVLKSLDGKNFTTVSTISGNGTTHQNTKYNYTDFNINESAWYQLKQVDFDGQFEYSSIIKTVNNKHNSVFELFSDRVKITPNEELVYRLIGPNGVILNSHSINEPTSLMARNYSPGLYILVTNENGKQEYMKWMVSAHK